MNLFKTGLFGGGLLLSLCSVSLAEIKLPAFFSDGMVLQQETGANLWGWADAGQVVKVDFSGQSESAKADDAGRWKIEFKGLKASRKGAALTITAGEEKRQIEDVVVGEVWIASGQSNMEWTVAKTRSKVDGATAKDDLLRVYVSVNKTAAGELTDFEGSWMSTKPENTMQFTAVGYEFGKSLRAKLGVPVGIIECAWGGKPVEAFISEEALLNLPEGKVLLDRKAEAMRNWEEKKRGVSPELNPRFHSTIYNAMIAPIAGYSARGAIWYQGESNANKSTSEVYGELLECMIKDWRERWGSNLSFYYVQLANYKKGKNPDWVNVQDEMRRLLDDEDMQAGNIGMATINDIGHATNIHPMNKKDVGERLARWALNKDYGMKDVVVSGPLYRSREIKGDSIIVSFDYAKGLRAGDGKALGAFEVAGADGKWVAAEAIRDGEKIRVMSEEVKDPKRVRYAWTPFAVGANVVNGEGLPMSCFVTK